MKKMYVDQLHTGCNTMALSLDAQWFGMHRSEATEEQRTTCENIYCGLLTSLGMLGGDWKRDSKGKHRVFLAGLSSIDVDDYNEEEG